MFRTSDIVLIAVMVVAAAFTYRTKHEAENELAEVRTLQRQIQYEEDTIDLLKADWSILTQPARLQRLTELYQPELLLQPVEARQIVGLDELPSRPVEIPDPAGEPPEGMADAAQDPTVTGGVAR